LIEFYGFVGVQDAINFFETNSFILTAVAKETTNKEEKEEDSGASNFGCSAEVPQGRRR
jgi:hypothetical protein